MLSSTCLSCLSCLAQPILPGPPFSTISQSPAHPVVKDSKYKHLHSPIHSPIQSNPPHNQARYDTIRYDRNCNCNCNCLLLRIHRQTDSEVGTAHWQPQIELGTSPLGGSAACVDLCCCVGALVSRCVVVFSSLWIGDAQRSTRSAQRGAGAGM